MNNTKKTTQSKTAKKRSIFSFLMPSVVITLVLLPLLGYWLVMQTVSPVNERYRLAISQIQQSALKSVLNHHFQQKQTMLANLATNSQLLAAIKSNDLIAIEQFERIQTQLSDVLQLRVSLPEQAQPQDGRLPNLGFVGADMIAKVELGEAAAPQLHPYPEQDGTLILFVQPVLAANDKHLATISASFDVKFIEQLMQSVIAEKGAAQIQQTILGSGTQIVASIGQIDPAKVVKSSLSVNDWQLLFSPNLRLQQYSVIAPMEFWLPIFVAMLILLLGIIVPVWILQAQVRKETGMVARYVQKVLAGQHTALPAVKIALYSSLLESLSRVRFSKQVVINHPDEEGLSMEADDMAHIDAIPEVAVSKDDVLDIDDNDSSIMEIHMGERDHDRLGIEGSQVNMPVPNSGVAITESLFVGDHIRGVVGETIDAALARVIGLAIGSEAKDRGEQTIIVGRDGRVSSEQLHKALIVGLTEAGRDVLDLSVVPTPLVSYATKILGVNSGVMVTGSHSSADHNGFKVAIAGQPLMPNELLALYQRIQAKKFISGTGSVTQNNIVNNYVKRVTSDLRMDRPLKVVLDAGNGVAGLVAPALFEALGCQVVSLYCDVDGDFPNHHPNPTEVTTLADLQKKVQQEQADLGFAFDADADRLGMVTNEGHIIPPDRMMMLLAKHLLKRKANAIVVHDVRSSRRLKALISGYGGRAVMSKSGSALIRRKMKEVGALLAGDMDGHIYFRERWYGFEDAIYAAARIAEVIATENKSAEQQFSAFPADVSTPELSMPVAVNVKNELIARLIREGQFPNGTIGEIDGLRVDYSDGWGMVRAHNNEDKLMFRFEADSASALRRIQEVFKLQLQKCDADLKLPY